MELSHLREQGVVVRIWVCKLRTDLIEAINLAFEFPNSLLDVAQDCFLLVKWRLLKQNANCGIFCKSRFSIGRIV